jgi:hypothetical protein
MGARRKDRGRKPVILSVEPLEDRFLLSGGSLVEAPPAASYSTHSSVANQQNAPPRTDAQNVLPPKLPTSGPSVPTAPANSLSPAVVQYPSSPSLGENALLQLLNSVALLRASAASAAYRPDDDDDDDLPAMDRDGGYAHPNQMLALPSLFTNQNADGLDPCCAILIQEQGPAQNGVHLALLNLFSTAGLGSAATTVVPTVSRVAASGDMGEHAGKPAREERTEPIPELPNPSGSLDTPPAGESENQQPAPVLGVPFADLLPIDVEAIQRSADAFFEQIAQISEEWHDNWIIQKLTPWLVIATVAGYQWVRLRRRQVRSAPDNEESWGPNAMLISD